MKIINFISSSSADSSRFFCLGHDDELLPQLADNVYYFVKATSLSSSADKKEGAMKLAIVVFSKLMTIFPNKNCLMVKAPS